MRILQKLSDESGQTLVFAALSMVILIAFLGLAVDVGHLRYAKRQLQVAADAAALAAGMEIRVCGGGASCPYMQTAAQSALTENGFSTSNVTFGCNSSSGVGLTMEINDPPCAIATDPNKTNTASVEVLVSQQQPMYFAKILGIQNVLISARAEAIRNPTAPCIYALDQTGDGAINTGLLALGVNSKCGIVDESNSKQALTCGIGLLLSAPKISVKGGTAGLLCGSTPPAITGVPRPVPNDPLGYLVPPPNANDPCPSNTDLYARTFTGSSFQVNISALGGTYVLHPGVYCGGISISAGLLTNVTFTPGTYVLKQGPGMLLNILGIPILGGVQTGGFQVTLGLLSTINAKGVTFYNETPTSTLPSLPSLNITAPSTLGLAGFSMTAPTTGEYAGILFFQQHGNTIPGGFILGLLQNTNNFEGAIYMPDASLDYGVSALSASYNILVAKDISFGLVSVLSAFGNNYSNLPGGSPLNGDDAVLVQ
jgi:Flp pilus assembly protein TadG